MDHRICRRFGAVHDRAHIRLAVDLTSGDAACFFPLSDFLLIP